MTSTRPKQQQLAFDFSDEVVSPDVASELQPEQSSSAAMEKPALDPVSFDLTERIVDDGNMERAWKKVKANRGAPGPDGITLEVFFETFRHQWPEVRRQLLEGTYRPGPTESDSQTGWQHAESRNSKRDRSPEILNRNRGISMTQRLKELRQYVRGWMGYFALEQRKSLSRELDKWLRRRLRACYWKQWRRRIA